MTIDEFMEDVAPKMRKGWVAMDEAGGWFWFYKKPNTFGCAWTESVFYPLLFDIVPIDDWTKSLRRVGNDK